MALLEIAGVSKTWPGAAAPLLDDVSVEVEAGCFAVVEGANGTGKTTLMRIVAGLLYPDCGAVRVAGMDARSQRSSFQRQIGMASAGNTGLYARLNAKQNLEFGARIAMLGRRSRDAAVRDQIERFALSGYSERRVDRLSMGQRQRVRLALAFLHAPSLVLLDEPATSLDADGVNALSEAIRRHLAGGGGAIWFGPADERRPLVADRSFALASGALTSFP
jgi:ABC-type multidrug transport system ATPase subunit